jgi:hypothetical protein
MDQHSTRKNFKSRSQSGFQGKSLDEKCRRKVSGGARHTEQHAISGEQSE